MRCVVRIAAVRIHCHHGRIVGNQVFALECFQNPLLHFVFVGAAITHAAANFLECGCGDGVNRVARGEVGLDLLVGESGFEQRHQIA